LVTTAIGGVSSVCPCALRIAANSGRIPAGPYFSARAVPAPTRMTSASARNSAKARLSAGPEIEPDR
jgi:hypothetical protein